jgi:hypothetical protein
MTPALRSNHRVPLLAALALVTLLATAGCKTTESGAGAAQTQRATAARLNSPMVGVGY